MNLKSAPVKAETRNAVNKPCARTVSPHGLLSRPLTELQLYTTTSIACNGSDAMLRELWLLIEAEENHDVGGRAAQLTVWAVGLIAELGISVSKQWSSKRPRLLDRTRRDELAGQS